MSRMSLEDLDNLIGPLCRGYEGRELEHVASGHTYRVLGFQYREVDMSVEWTYEPVDDGPSVAFSRPLVELFDGRFRILPPAA